MGEGLFELLGIEPMLGRTFAADEFQPGKNQVLVLSHRLWQRRFGGETNIIGQNATLDGKSYVIIGVMPPAFRFAPFWAVHAEMWAPLSLADRVNVRGGHSLRVFARLKPGVSRERAQAEMDAIGKRLEVAYPESNKGLTVSVDSLHDKAVGKVRPALLVLLAAVVFVLMIACGNVANLMLARATVRQRELAIRAALGAGHWRLVKQLLSESALLALFGAILGLLIAFLGVDVLMKFVQGRIPRFEGVQVNVATLGFALLVSFATGIAFGLVPAVRSSRPDLTGSLKESNRSSTEGCAQGRIRSALIVAEVAVALVLLVRSSSRLNPCRACNPPARSIICPWRGTIGATPCRLRAVRRPHLVSPSEQLTVFVVRITLGRWASPCSKGVTSLSAISWMPPEWSLSMRPWLADNFQTKSRLATVSPSTILGIIQSG